MSGVTVISFPAIANPFKASWGLQRNDGSFQSPLNGYTQDLERPGAMWACSLTWQVLSDTDAAKLAAWLTQMAKAGIRCRLPNFGYTRHGVGGGTPLVNGGAQTGLSLATKGWPNSTSKVVATGDLIQLATGQLLMATADANSDGSGNSTVSIEPALRTSPADSSALTLAAPSGLFKLVQNGGSSSGINPNYTLAYAPAAHAPIASVSIDLLEDVS